MKFLLLVLLLVGCSTTKPPPKPHQMLDNKKIYKRDMILSVNGVEGEGTLVVPHNIATHKFLVTSRGKLDMFTLETCHREWTKEKSWNVKVKSGIFGWRRTLLKDRVEFDFTPTKLEKSDCLMELGGYEAKGGRHSWALIDFQDEIDTLPAKILCNGNIIKSKGVSICQSKKGLLQQIEFKDLTLLETSTNCRMKIKQGKEFQFLIKKGRCMYHFLDTKTNRTHRLTTFGYEGILIRN